jgi:hypothetical protein
MVVARHFWMLGISLFLVVACGGDDVDGEPWEFDEENQGEVEEENAPTENNISHVPITDIEWEVTPEELQFDGTLDEGETQELSIEVGNIGEASFELSDVRFGPGTHDGFEIGDGWPGDEAIELSPGDFHEISVVFRESGQQEERTGAVIIAATNDDDAKAETVRLAAEAPPITCPEAQGRIFVDGVPNLGYYAGAPEGSEVMLDATDSVGSGLTYQWTLLSTPSGVSDDIIEDPTAVQTLIELPVLGEYEVELTVYAQNGEANCNDVVFLIDAVTNEDIRVEVAWRRADGEIGGAGDLDLHYLNSKGEWGSFHYDVSHNNRQPEWDDGSTVVHHIDSMTGEFPEVVVHNNPDPASYYSAGVFYFSGAPSLSAAARVYLHGILVAEVEQVLHNAGGSQPDMGDFWHVADILVEQDGVLDIDMIDNVYVDQGFP